MKIYLEFLNKNLSIILNLTQLSLSFKKLLIPARVLLNSTLWLRLTVLVQQICDKKAQLVIKVPKFAYW